MHKKSRVKSDNDLISVSLKEEFVMVQLTHRKLLINLKEIVVWLFALYGIRAVWLAFNSMEYSPTFYLLNLLIGYLCIPAGFLILIKDQKCKANTKDVLLLFIPLTYWLLFVFNTYGGWELGNGIVTLIQISIFLLLNNKIKVAIFDRFYKIIQMCNIISIFVWICYQVRIPIGFQTVNFYYGSFAAYNKWFIFAMYHNNSSVTTLTDRLCGIFNEPGALGTICALLFIATFQYSKNWEKALLLITGGLTYSAAFFVLVFGYLVIYLFQKNVKYAVIAVIIGLLFLLIPKIDFGNDALNLLASRLEITDSGFAGDNRIDAGYKAGYEAMKDTNDIYFGYGKDFEFAGNTSSYVKYIVQFGYIGFGLMMVQWVIATMMRVKTREQLIYILLFFISLYQRPAPITSILGFLLVFGGLAWMQQKERILIRIKNE